MEWILKKKYLSWSLMWWKRKDKRKPGRYMCPEWENSSTSAASSLLLRLLLAASTSRRPRQRVSSSSMYSYNIYTWESYEWKLGLSGRWTRGGFYISRFSLLLLVAVALLVLWSCYACLWGRAITHWTCWKDFMLFFYSEFSIPIPGSLCSSS